MFDDWAYREHVETPVSAQTPRRHRAVSLVQSVAHAKVTPMWDVPEPVLRPRANSLPRSHDPTLLKPEYPWGRKEQARLNNWHDWLSPDHVQPAFDEQLFAGKVAESVAILERSNQAKKSCEDLLADSNALLEKMDSINSFFTAIADEMAALKLTNDEGVALQLKLDNMCDSISGALKYYDQLETITRILNKPGTKVARREGELRDILTQIDEGLAFCQAHEDFKDMDLYELRYKQCLTRALTLAQEYVVAKLRDIFESIRAKVTKSSAAAGALLWTKFETDASAFKSTIDILRVRTEPEYQSIFNETEAQYFMFRGQLISSEIQSYLPKPGTDILATFNATITQFKELYVKELQIYEAVVGPRRDAFDQWLVEISEPLYDVFRSYIIRETSIENLCQILIVLQPNADLVQDWATVTDPIAKDAQNRLLFRAEILVDNIVRYEPTTKDFTKKLYPTVDTSLRLLSQVSQLMNNRIFGDLTHRCVHQCILSLSKAFEKACAQLGAIRGTLFHIQQLAALQVRIVEFDVDKSVQHEVDFSGLQAFVTAIRQVGTNELSSFREFLDFAWTSVPQVVEYMFDSMEELYNSLHTAVERFTEAAMNLLLEPIAKNDPRSAQDDTKALKTHMEKQLKDLGTSISQYIQDQKIADALIESIQEAISSKYGDYYSTIYAAGSPEQLEGVMDSDSFTSWLSHLTLSIRNQ